MSMTKLFDRQKVKYPKSLSIARISGADLNYPDKTNKAWNLKRNFLKLGRIKQKIDRK